MTGDDPKDDQVKTAQPFNEDNKDKTFRGMGGDPPKPRPDLRDDKEKRAESNKVTQREE